MDTTEQDVKVPSMADLLNEAYDLAVKICYSDVKKGKVRDTSGYGAETESLLWNYVDRQIHVYHEKRRTGHCSLQSFIDYDIGAEDEKPQKHVETFRALLGKIQSKQAA